MSKITKEINHDFNIGDVVWILHDYAIIPCVIIGISCSPLYTEIIDGGECVDKNTIEYTLVKLRRHRNIDGLVMSMVSISDCNKYTYHSSKVYGIIDELLSDLKKTTEIP